MNTIRARGDMASVRVELICHRDLPQTRKDLTKNERRNEQYLGTRVGGFCAACQYGLAHELERSATLATATSVATARVQDCDGVTIEAGLQVTRLNHGVMRAQRKKCLYGFRRSFCNF